VRRLRTLTLVAVVLAVVGAAPLFFGIRAAARDPVFVELDSLRLPSWAATSHEDEAHGSRWCIRQCRYRLRTWQSSRGPDETAAIFEKALRSAGWTTWLTPSCPAEGVEGYDTCWQMDEYALDLWTHAPPCYAVPVRPGASPTASPTAGPTPGPTAGTGAAPGCGGAVVTARVFNRVATHTGQG
jgi:hypothetical protein